MAWRAHHNLVTLRVRNASLADVVRKIERQTWEKVSVDKKLDALITLNVKNRPLAEVLDRVAQQSGARWSTVHAVYDAKEALPRLESALRGDRKLEEVGWKMIAPIFSSDLHGATNGPWHNSAGNGGPIIVRGGQGSGPGIDMARLLAEAKAKGGKIVTATEDEIVEGTGTNQAGTSLKGKRPQTVSVMRMGRKSADGGKVEEEIWSPEELVMESRLSSRLAEGFSTSPSAEGAAKTAEQARGRWKTYYALRKSVFGMDFAGMPARARKSVTGGSGEKMEIIKGTGTNANQQLVHAPSAEDLADTMRQQRLNELGKLTPEQRVLRMRERQNQTQTQTKTN